MAIIPLVVDGDNPTVVQTVDAFDIDGNAVFIRNMDQDSLTDDSSNVSYDLRIGQEYRDHRDVGKHDLQERGEIILYPGAAVIIETEEFIQLPRTLFAFIVPKVALLQKGLSNTMSKVDPGYHGHLLVTLFNLGQQPVTLRRQDSCCALCVLQVQGEANPYSKSPKRIDGEAKRSWLRSSRDFVQRNNAAFTAVLMIVTAISILMNVWVLISMSFE